MQRLHEPNPEAPSGPEVHTDGGVQKSRKTIVLDVISFIARFFMAYIWISAGVPKLGGISGVAQSIEAYGIFTQEWAGYLAMIIGPVELVGGILLLIGLVLKPASKLATVVLVLFIIGIIQAWARGLQLDCGCFGQVDPATVSNFGLEYTKVIIRDLIFIALSLWTVFRPFTKWSLDSYFQK